MGLSCSTQLTINESVYLQLKANPDKTHLLMLNLHYQIYDSKSKKMIDELTSLAINHDHTVHIDAHKLEDVAQPIQ